MVAVTISAALPPSVPAQPPIFYFALFLVALGSGWMKSSLMPLGAAQFDDDNPLDVERKGAFFSNFYMCLVVGSLISGTVIIWIQENIGWVVGYGAAASCVALGLAGFLVATPLFKKQAPYGSPLVSIVQVVVASFRKIWLKVPSDASLLYEGGEETKREERLAHTMHFSFLDKATTQDAADQLGGRPDPWRLCTVTQVEKLKLLLGTSTIWLMSAVFTTAYGQFSTTILEQTNAMDTTVLSFRLPAASLSAVEVVFVMLSAALHDNLLAPLAARCTGNPRGLTLLQRMGIGRALMVLAMASAAITESRRLDAALHGERVNVAWQLPTCVLVGGADAMGFIAQLEFFYEEVPEGMKGMGTALYLMSIAAGNYLCSLMVRAVQAATARGGRKGWIPEDLDEGRLDCFFWGLCGLSALNLVAHVVVSRKYKPRKPTVYQDEI